MPVMTKRKPNYLTTTFTQYFQLTAINEPPTSTSTSTLNDIEINESEVLTILSSLDGNKAPGIDDISPRVYRHCSTITKTNLSSVCS